MQARTKGSDREPFWPGFFGGKYMRCVPAGDCAIMAEFPQEISTRTNDRVHGLAREIVSRQIPGITELVPAFCSLMIYYQPQVISYGELKKRIEELEEGEVGTFGKKKRILKIPCCYGARFGCDLADMEQYMKLTRDEIIAIHSSVDYKIYMRGFLPGFVYLGGLDKRLEMPRLKIPRIKIQPGAVGIGGNQTGVYPLASPGGWWLLGGTPVDFYNPDREEPVLCSAGEYIRFIPITIDDYYDIRRMIQKGSYKVVTEEEEGERLCQ